MGLAGCHTRACNTVPFLRRFDFQEAGLKPGDRVMLSGQNHPCWPVAYFGILYAGGVAVPMDVEFSQHKHSM